jgi:NADH-quinone oxidoreductase subunit I
MRSAKHYCAGSLSGRCNGRVAENTDDERYSPGERYAKTYEINMLRCIFCGYCEDACPTQAIELGHEHQLSLPTGATPSLQRTSSTGA